MSSLHVSRLYRYPVKSLPGISVDSLALDDFGPAGDRRWMLVDFQGRFVTQRAEPRLALIRVAFDTTGDIAFTLPNAVSSQLIPGTEAVSVTVWGDQVVGVKAAGPASAAISAWLGRELNLVYMPEDSVRPADPEFVSGERRVSFADGFPFLIANEASLSALETWTGKALDMRRFRPGVVISGAESFAEDGWRWLRVGGAILECVKPCSRCVMTTVDPDTGVAGADREPLLTLARHRKTPAGVIFGQNAVHWRGSSIAVGDPVELLNGSPL